MQNSVLNILAEYLNAVFFFICFFIFYNFSELSGWLVNQKLLRKKDNVSISNNWN